MLGERFLVFFLVFSCFIPVTFCPEASANSILRSSKKEFQVQDIYPRESTANDGVPHMCYARFSLAHDYPSEPEPERKTETHTQQTGHPKYRISLTIPPCWSCIKPFPKKRKRDLGTFVSCLNMEQVDVLYASYAFGSSHYLCDAIGFAGRQHRISAVTFFTCFAYGVFRKVWNVGVCAPPLIIIFLLGAAERGFVFFFSMKMLIRRCVFFGFSTSVNKIMHTLNGNVLNRDHNEWQYVSRFFNSSLSVFSLECGSAGDCLFHVVSRYLRFVAEEGGGAGGRGASKLCDAQTLRAKAASRFVDTVDVDEYLSHCRIECEQKDINPFHEYAWRDLWDPREIIRIKDSQLRKEEVKRKLSESGIHWGNDSDVACLEQVLGIGFILLERTGTPASGFQLQFFNRFAKPATYSEYGIIIWDRQEGHFQLGCIGEREGPLRIVRIQQTKIPTCVLDEMVSFIKMSWWIFTHDSDDTYVNYNMTCAEADGCIIWPTNVTVGPCVGSMSRSISRFWPTVGIVACTSSFGKWMYLGICATDLFRYWR
jgi:hypothetical protein